MRLTCPNCSAQYDIPVDMVPPEGRDVQCSNCATVWFQEGRAEETEAVAAAVGAAAAPAGPAGAAERRPLADEKTLDVLRQERAHEARVRAAERRRSRVVTRVASAPDGEAEGPTEMPRALAAAERARMAQAASVARARDEVEDPEDLDVAEEDDDDATRPAVPTVSDDVSEAIARTLRQMADETRQPDAAPSDDPETAGRGSRRDLLPDIEEINSSLRPDERALEAEEDGLSTAQARLTQEEEGRSGFRLGFLLVMGIVGLFVALYVFAAPLAEAAPPLADALGTFVRTVDELRAGLAAQVDALALRILSDR